MAATVAPTTVTLLLGVDGVSGVRLGDDVVDIPSAHALTVLANLTCRTSRSGLHRATGICYDTEPGAVASASPLALYAGIGAGWGLAGALGADVGVGAVATAATAAVVAAVVTCAVGLADTFAASVADSVTTTFLGANTAARGAAAIVFRTVLVSAVRRAITALGKLRTELTDVFAAIAVVLALVIAVAGVCAAAAVAFAGARSDTFADGTDEPLGTFSTTSAAAVIAAFNVLAVGLTLFALAGFTAKEALSAVAAASTAAVAPTFLARTVGRAALAELAVFTIFAPAVLRAGCTIFAFLGNAGVVPAVRQAEGPATIDDALFDAEVVP